MLSWLDTAGFAAYVPAFTTELRDHAASGAGAHLLAVDDTDLRTTFRMADAAERARFLAAVAAARAAAAATAAHVS